MNHAHPHGHDNGHRHRTDEHLAGHLERIASARADMAAVDILDLATASRAEMAIAVERLRGCCAELIRAEQEHHPDV